MVTESDLLQNYKNIINKNERIIQLFKRWMLDNYQNHSPSAFLRRNNFLSVAIYGYGALGQVLYESLRKERIEIVYVVESKRERWAETEATVFFLPDAELPGADAMIVTPITSFDEVYDNMRNKVSCPIFSLEDLV